jgi:hypothetical protein
MKKFKTKSFSSKQNTFPKREKKIMLWESPSAEIRIGIGIADDLAKKELKQRRLEAPFTIEEKILRE